MGKHELFVGDAVTYGDINLRHYSGVITNIGPTKNGGNCLVKWDKFPFVSEEYLPNLGLIIREAIIEYRKQT